MLWQAFLYEIYFIVLVAAFQQKSGGRGAKFADYFRNSRLFLESMSSILYVLFIRKKLTRQLKLRQKLASSLREACILSSFYYFCWNLPTRWQLGCN